MEKILDWEKYIETAAETVAEGVVMLKNNNALPLKRDETVSVFGRIQLNYYKSGTGSGGMVNVSKVTGIVDGLIEAGVKINDGLLEIYKEWVKENPFDFGKGWGNEPWSQTEMILDDETVKNAASVSSTAIIIIGRTAGEEQDLKPEEGSFLLTGIEKDMISKVRREFEKVIILLNVGSLIDMNFIEKINPDAILYVWQGGMVGGTGTAKVLTGEISPSGKLPDTIAFKVSDYLSDRYFGNRKKNYYSEDIFVGYRYFDTFAPEKVRYPFGYGLSYTKFSVEYLECSNEGTKIDIGVRVMNDGTFKGKEVIMVFVEKPQGRLGQPLYVLCAFEKTDVISPYESQMIHLQFDLKDFASYDDSGATGHKNCWILEGGKYKFYVMCNNEKTYVCYKKIQEDLIVRKCSQAAAPVEQFRRVVNRGGIAFEDVPLSETDEKARREENMPEETPYTGDRGIKLSDVADGKNTIDEFIAQLSDAELSYIVKGEGMGSPRVTAGTAAAFGNVSDSLGKYGIPAACCADGPSGMRFDCGAKAFSLPNGTLIASTFNKNLVENLFEMFGLEMAANRVDSILGAGMNIHRHPLNGRNFEYFSEDPFLTGTMAAAQLRGLHKSGVTGTLKHFCANNQETDRHILEAIVSERALREIYMKGFEIAVRDGNADSIMTTYGLVNGLWTAGNYDICTQILRNEWNFDGIVMTDWFADINRRNRKPNRTDLSAMVQAQNDLYMVCGDCEKYGDNVLSSLESGDLTRAELQRSAKNICRFLLHTNAFRRLTGEEDTVKIINRPDDEIISDEPATLYNVDDSATIDLSGITSEKGKNYGFAVETSKKGFYRITLTASSVQSSLAQIPVTIFAMGTASGTFTWNGTDGKPVSFSTEIPMFSRFTSFRLYFAQSGLDLVDISFEFLKPKE